jgi:hypothetical protein
MRRVYLELTADQVKRGVCFSSSLSMNKTEDEDGTVHEVLKNHADAYEQKRRLLDDSFFNASPWNYNVVRR